MEHKDPDMSRFDLSRDKARTRRIRKIIRQHGGWDRVLAKGKEYKVLGHIRRSSILSVLGLSERTLRRWVADKYFPTPRFLGFWRRKDFAAWLDVLDAVIAQVDDGGI